MLSQREFETLAIFGAKRSRQGAMLKVARRSSGESRMLWYQVMSAVETKIPGHFTNDIELTECHDEGEGMDVMRLEVTLGLLWFGKCLYTAYRDYGLLSECLLL